MRFLLGLLILSSSSAVFAQAATPLVEERPSIDAPVLPPGDEIGPDEEDGEEDADDDSEEDEDAFDPIEWFLIPLVGYTSDVGFAGALLAMVFHYEEGYEPYRDKVQVIATLTTRLVQYHQLIWERVGIFGLPLRLETSLTFSATPVGNYCGIGNLANCDLELARDAARQAGLRPEDDAWGGFVRDYYRFRVMRPSGSLALRWKPPGSPFELQFQWLGDYGVSGFFGSEGPYPGSLYAQDFPDGEAHFLSELRTGVLLDTRDDERRPGSGYLLSATVRASFGAIGSHWDFFGINLAAAQYAALDDGGRVVIANRAVADVIIGDAPTTAQGALGGYWSDVAFGGTVIGRGVRARRFIGDIKLFLQSEIRWAFVGEPLKFQVVLIGFGDVGWVGADVRDFGGDKRHLLVSFGGGLAAYWGQNFILRFDAAVSPEENYSPQFYINLLHPY